MCGWLCAYRRAAAMGRLPRARARHPYKRTGTGAGGCAGRHAAIIGYHGELTAYRHSATPTSRPASFFCAPHCALGRPRLSGRVLHGAGPSLLPPPPPPPSRPKQRPGETGTPTCIYFRATVKKSEAQEKSEMILIGGSEFFLKARGSEGGGGWVPPFALRPFPRAQVTYFITITVPPFTGFYHTRNLRTQCTWLPFSSVDTRRYPK